MTEEETLDERRARRHLEYLKNADVLRAYGRAYHEARRQDPEYVEKRRVASRRSHLANRDERLKRKREDHAERMANDPAYAERSRAANKKMNQKRITKAMAPVREAAARGCLHCGEVDIICLDFHHLDPTTKSFEVSQSARQRKTDDEVYAEIRKCVVLCANDHRRVHADPALLDGLDLAAYWS